MTSFNQDQQNAAATGFGGSATAAITARGGTRAPASAAAPNAGRIVDADDGTSRHGTARIRSSTTSKDGISWECSNLLHFEDVNKEVEDDGDSSVSSDDDNDNVNAPKNRNNASASTRRRTHAVNNDLANAFSNGLTMRRTSSVESFQQKIIEKHTSSGSLNRVSSLHASSGNGNNGGSSLRSYLSFGRGPDAAGGVPLRTATGATSGTGAGSNANFEHQRGNGIGSSSQSRRNASASSAGRALLDRRRN